VPRLNDRDKAAGLAQRGVSVRVADYRDPESLVGALEGVDRVLLVASTQLQQREAQHRNGNRSARPAHTPGDRQARRRRGHGWCSPQLRPVGLLHDTRPARQVHPGRRGAGEAHETSSKSRWMKATTRRYVAIKDTGVPARPQPLREPPDQAPPANAAPARAAAAPIHSPSTSFCPSTVTPMAA
jgi:hypothetical protein